MGRWSMKDGLRELSELTKQGVIRNYEFKEDEFKLYTDAGTIIISIENECCNDVWFEYDDFEKLLNNSIVNITSQEIEMEHSKRQKCDDNVEYKFELSNGEEFRLIARSSSNGYYSFILNVDYNYRRFRSDSKIVIILGLPYSGKSTYMVQNYENYVKYDDFLSTIYKFNLVDDLRKGSPIVLNDPRLCNKSDFDKLYDFLLDFVDPNQITIIKFKNDPIQCYKNSKKYSEYNMENIIYQGKNYEETLESLENNYSPQINVKVYES